MVWYFPGESARASLKPRKADSGIVEHVVFPGRISPGLIEAMQPSRGCNGGADISRANQPGPH